MFFILIWTPASPAPNSRKLKSKSKKVLEKIENLESLKKTNLIAVDKISKSLGKKKIVKNKFKKRKFYKKKSK